jgi:hypothetical protein
MGVFVVKMLTILGFVFYAGGPVDALQLAFGGNARVAPLGVACDGCERTAASTAAVRVQAVALLRPAIGEAVEPVSGLYEGTQ